MNENNQAETERRTGQVNIDVKVGIKGLVILGGVIYFAARAGAKKGIKQVAGEPGFLMQLKTAMGAGAVDGLKQAGVWKQSTDKVTEEPTPGDGGLPPVVFRQKGPEDVEQ